MCTGERPCVNCFSDQGPCLDKPTVGEILQRIYDSEIHFSLGWMWDGGFDYSIGQDLTYLHDGAVSSTGVTTISEAMPLIADEICKEYPASTFAKWWEENK